jgi:hypothetical protein
VSTIDDRETAEVVARRVVADLADACSIETVEEDGRLHARVFVHHDPKQGGPLPRVEAFRARGLSAVPSGPRCVIRGGPC